MIAAFFNRTNLYFKKTCAGIQYFYHLFQLTYFKLKQCFAKGQYPECVKRQGGGKKTEAENKITLKSSVVFRR